jgi:hypothetical protein
MKKYAQIAAIVVFSFAAGSAVAARVRDWHDIDAAHNHLIQVIRELERARKRNNYDMQGHGAKAEDFARQAERELSASVQAIRSEH